MTLMTLNLTQGRKPRGTGDDPPQSLRWGDSPCIRLPNILRSSVVGCARKYEKSKKGVFLVRERSCTTFNKVKIRKIRQKRGKIRKTWSMTKKWSSEIFAGEMEIL